MNGKQYGKQSEKEGKKIENNILRNNE